MAKTTSTLLTTPKKAKEPMSSSDEAAPEQDVEVDGVATVNEEEEVIPFRYSITSYGADYPVDSLVKRLESNAIFVPPFQRGYVWRLTQASRFIESLLLGLPVPGIFLAREPGSGSLLVIDGQQRLLTLKYFYRGHIEDSPKIFSLTGVQPQFIGLTYEDLNTEDRLRLDDSIIHATVVKQEEPSDDQSSIYHVFERLNTGGTPLSPQEIRAAIFHGSLNDTLKKLNGSTNWRRIFTVGGKRMRDEEMILRFLAFRFSEREYEEPLKGFLNDFMGENKDANEARLTEFENAFNDAIEVVYETVGDRAFRVSRTFNAAVFDSVMIGLSRRLAKNGTVDQKKFAKRYEALLADPNYLSTIESRTAQRDVVSERIRLATTAFSRI